MNLLSTINFIAAREYLEALNLGCEPKTLSNKTGQSKKSLRGALISFEGDEAICFMDNEVLWIYKNDFNRKMNRSQRFARDDNQKANFSVNLIRFSQDS
jgi:hypothetical protein